MSGALRRWRSAFTFPRPRNHVVEGTQRHRAFRRRQDARSASAEKRAIVDQLPGLPPEAQGFVAVSQRFADRVRDVISGNGDLPPLATEAETQFGDQAFIESVDVVEGFFSSNCPTTIIPTPSPAPS